MSGYKRRNDTNVNFKKCAHALHLQTELLWGVLNGLCCIYRLSCCERSWVGFDRLLQLCCDRVEECCDPNGTVTLLTLKPWPANSQGLWRGVSGEVVLRCCHSGEVWNKIQHFKFARLRFSPKASQLTP